MKTAILILLLSITCIGQSKDSTICAERGHILSGAAGITAAWYPPEYVDLPDRTLEIYWDKNIATYSCKRCGKEIRKPVQDKPDTTVIYIANQRFKKESSIQPVIKPSTPYYQFSDFRTLEDPALELIQSKYDTLWGNFLKVLKERNGFEAQCDSLKAENQRLKDKLNEGSGR